MCYCIEMIDHSTGHVQFKEMVFSVHGSVVYVLWLMSMLCTPNYVLICHDIEPHNVSFFSSTYSQVFSHLTTLS